MASKKRSTKMIPPDYSIGKNVFPVIPLRTRIGGAGVIDTDQASIVAGNVLQQLELDLDFESNEVFDVLAIQFDQRFQPGIVPGTNISVMRSVVALTDDPDKAVTTPIYLEDVFEGDDSFVWYKHTSKRTTTAVDVATIDDTVFYEYFIFEQPWTVARNMAWICCQFSTAAGDFITENNLTVWGRRRNASDDEFKSIIYRQRF